MRDGFVLNKKEKGEIPNLATRFQIARLFRVCFSILIFLLTQQLTIFNFNKIIVFPLIK